MENEVEWSKEMLDKQEMFDNVIFSDESTTALERHR